MSSKPNQTRDCLTDDGRAFRKSLTVWFADNARDYPWRRTRDPYAILVSELMLQQTQIATVLERGFYSRWLQLFPDTKTLATAHEDDVLKCWEGLGYYSRARNLQAAAQIIEEELEGNFPAEAKDIQRLPGVGPYTAGAVASIAFDQPAAIVDGNVARVLSRVFDLQEAVDGSLGSKMVWDLARQLMPRRKNAKSREYNSALMELGQRICKRSSPLCHTCPIAHFCASREPESLPIKKQRQKTVLLEEHVLLCLRNDSVLLEQEKGTRRKGLWKLPERKRKKSAEPILSLKYSITKYRVTMNVYEEQAGELADARWFAFDELDTVTLGAPYRRALTKLL